MLDRVCLHFIGICERTCYPKLGTVEQFLQVVQGKSPESSSQCTSIVGDPDQFSEEDLAVHKSVKQKRMPSTGNPF